MANINDAISNISAKVDTTSQALRASIYDENGNIVNSFVVDPLDTDRAIPVRNITGNSNQLVGAKGTGGFSPSFDCQNNYTDLSEKKTLSLDSSGNLITRGQSLTDEGSWRDDFTGTSIFSTITGTVSFINGNNTIIGTGTAFLSELSRNNYIRHSSQSNSFLTKISKIVSDTELILNEGYLGTTQSGTCEKTNFYIHDSSSTGTLSVLDSKLTLLASTTINDVIGIDKICDYSPIRATLYLSISQRIANQEIYVGFKNTEETQETKLIFSGTNANLCSFVTKSSNGASDIQTTNVSIPFGLFTNTLNKYEILVTEDSVHLFINDIELASHFMHIPDIYTPLNFYTDIKNGATAPASATSLDLDIVSVSNINRLEIANSFRNDQVTVKFSENINSKYSSLTTSSSASDQVILSLTVPTGKTLLIKGYSLDNNATAINGTIKIGKNTITTEPTSPGVVGSNFFRVLNIPANTPFIEYDYSQAKEFAYSGDVVKITVTPSGNTSTIWRATLDYILR